MNQTFVKDGMKGEGAMSMENAKKLVSELLANEAKKDEFMKDPEAFMAAGGYDCTLEEMKEYYDMNHELDDEEMTSLTGGRGCVAVLSGSLGGGGCS